MKNLNQQEGPENKEKAKFLKQYPLPKDFEQYADKAWELKQIVSKIYDDNKSVKKVNDFLIKLEEKVGEKINDCYLFRMFSGGSHEITTFFDFEGEDSIENFLNTLQA